VVKRRATTHPEQWQKALRDLGLRLRGLRKKAGLTQSQVAVLTGRTGSGGKSWVCQVERGCFSGLTVDTLLDLLRAVGAGLADVAGALDPYLRLPQAVEKKAREAVARATAGLPSEQGRRARYYDIGLSLRGRVEARSDSDVQQRAERAVRHGLALERERRLRAAMNEELNRMGINQRSVPGINLKTYGRKVFGDLRRTRLMRRVWRDKALAKLDQWPTRYRLPAAEARRIRAAVTALFQDMARKGNLDRP
jgi:transcriptional regulator with XRE-family HTH domain